MHRLIVTGANGAGKSHMAARLGKARPDVPVISFDAIKLTRNWQQRARSDMEAELARVIQQDAWIIEGGPSLLPIALTRAEGIIWLDPPKWRRAWRLAARPWRNMGKTRAELPPGNPDWPLRQYLFAIRSLRNSAKFHDDVSRILAGSDAVRIWHVRSERDAQAAIGDWRSAISSTPSPRL